MLERITEELSNTIYDKNIYKDFYEEWFPGFGEDRVNDQAWIYRYDYESTIIAELCNNYNLLKVLELGSGPGVLSQNIMKKVYKVILYTCIDTPGAKEIFQKRKYKSTFLSKNMLYSLDISDLDTDYELIITNDFLEHIQNPSDILLNSYKISTNEAKLFVSIPNWRMGHSFIYRGLFDYDNWIYTLMIHGWRAIKVYGSPLTTSYFKKLDSETLLPENLITSWNWYFLCEKIIRNDSI